MGWDEEVEEEEKGGKNGVKGYFCRAELFLNQPMSSSVPLFFNRTSIFSCKTMLNGGREAKL